MSATTYIRTPARTARATLISRTLKAEWTKLRTLPSTWRTATLTLALGIGFGVAVAFSEISQWHTMTAQQRQVFDPASASMSGVMIAAVVLGALAVRTVTAEYSTGMIRSTFSAMPARRLVIAAKAATVAAFVFPIALLCDVAGFTLGQQILASIGVGLDAIIRHTAAATTALTLIIVGDVVLGQLLPAGLRQYLPGTAVQAAITVHRSAGLLTPNAAIAVLGAYAAIALAAALIRVGHRDA